MRRPTRAQITRRRATIALGALALVLAAWVLLRPDRTAPEAGTSPGTTPASATSADAPTTPPPTTISTGIFVTDAAEPGPVVGEGPHRTYRVEVEDGSGIPVEEFATEVERVLSDPRGWTTAQGIALQRNPTVEDIVITLATPATVDLLCYPLDTDGDVSCAKEGRAIINLSRWLEGAEPSGLDLEGYRAYLISHEVGHVLGHHHVDCPGPGALAPVMVQQTLGIGECRPNPWPAPDALTG